MVVAEGQKGRRAEAMGRASASLHILVVDDDPSVGRAVQRMLRHLGHRVSLAHHGAMALDIDLSDPADLLVTDMNMPGMDGGELISLIRNRRLAVPIILMTGGALEDVPAELCIDSKRIVIIKKPMTIEEISSSIEAMLTEV